MGRRSPRQLGLDAEKVAAAQLRRDGWRVLAQNWARAGAELDIVAQRGGVLAFVEVKARTGGHAAGVESVGGRKRRRLARAASAWLANYTQPFDSCSFVVVSMVPSVGGWDMDWLFQAFDV